MTIAAGDKIPALTVKTITADGPANTETSEIFGGKRVVLFGVPGAFTPTCTLNHLPGFLDNRDDILAKGVDEIAVVAVNDPFVVKAWAEQSKGIEKIRFISDWDAAFVKAMGLDIDLSGGGLGLRSKRFSMIVKDGVVDVVNIEDTPGTAEVSGAAHLLGQL